jgi:hypothetical protein
VQLVGQAADGKSFEALERSNVNGAAKDGFASTETAGLVARRRLARSAEGGGHEESVTRKNK